MGLCNWLHIGVVADTQNMTNQIPQSEIDRANYDILAVVESRMQVKKAGKNYVGLCPFHNEKTPSFNVVIDKNFCYCQGCGAGGDAVEFIMMYDGISFPAAVASINGDLPSSVTHEKVRESLKIDRTVKPSNHKEDGEKAKRILARCAPVENHMYLLSRNTAPAPDVQLHDLKGALVVELFNLSGELVNLAALTNEGIKYAAGGPSYGAVAVLEPAHEPDGATVLCVDYAEAWRLWWIMKGKTKIICAMEYENAKWIADKQRVRFTHVGCSELHQDEFLDYGHDVILIPDPYAAKVA